MICAVETLMVIAVVMCQENMFKYCVQMYVFERMETP